MLELWISSLTKQNIGLYKKENKKTNKQTKHT